MRRKEKHVAVWIRLFLSARNIIILVTTSDAIGVKLERVKNEREAKAILPTCIAFYTKEGLEKLRQELEGLFNQ